MPPFPPGLSEWFQQQGLPTGVLVFLGFVWYEVKASEARQAKRIDELRADMKELRAEQRASEARQREDMADLKADNRALGEKLDRLVESLLAAKQL